MGDAVVKSEMPVYRPRATLWALKIASVYLDKTTLKFWVIPKDEGYEPFVVSYEWFVRVIENFIQQRNAGSVKIDLGYYVVGTNQSWMPTDEFEAKYQRVKTGAL